jgi:hypothetical protein
MSAEVDDGWEEDLPDDEEEFFTVACPSCGAQIHEDAPCCPVCGDYVTSGSGRIWEGKPIWYGILAVLGMIALVVALITGF